MEGGVPDGWGSALALRGSFRPFRFHMSLARGGRRRSDRRRRGTPDSDSTMPPPPPDIAAGVDGTHCLVCEGRIPWGVQRASLPGGRGAGSRF